MTFSVSQITFRRMVWHGKICKKTNVAWGKIMKTHNQYSQYPGRDSNGALPYYTFRTPPVRRPFGAFLYCWGQMRWLDLLWFELYSVQNIQQVLSSVSEAELMQEKYELQVTERVQSRGKWNICRVTYNETRTCYNERYFFAKETANYWHSGEHGNKNETRNRLFFLSKKTLVYIKRGKIRNFLSNTLSIQISRYMHNKHIHCFHHMTGKNKYKTLSLSMNS